MCFSVTASFASGIALLVCGIAALTKARAERLKMIAAVPVIFGIQQCIEGFVWLSFINPAMFEWARSIASYLFLAIAGIIWPIWIPLAIGKFDQHLKYYASSLAAGIVVALGFIGSILFAPVTVAASCNIVYQLNLPIWVQAPGALFYMLATIMPFFITRNGMLWIIGWLITISYLATAIFYLEAFASVWCFFAAIISVFVYGFVSNESREN